MDQQAFISSNMNFQQFGNECPNTNIIKTEEVKDEDILLLGSTELDQLGGNNAFHMIQDLDMSGNQAVSAFSLQVPQFPDVPDATFLNRIPLDLSNVCRPDDIKQEDVSHFVEYKLQDGKHVKVWECGICGKQFGHQYTLMRHLPTHTDERKFQCNTCGKAFRQMSTLSQHRAIHSTERPYVCEMCHKTFNRVSTLISHRKTHTGMKPHQCHLCNKAFHQKGNLRNHIFTHTNERPYKCDICDKGFNQMSNLMCHKVKAHQRNEKPKYVCQICNKDFPKRISLRNHEQCQHGVNNQPLDMTVNPEHLKQSNTFRETNAIIVEPIKTEAMRIALESNQIPFALLRPLTGIPVLVRVLPAGDKQMLVPATAEDLKKHGHISITQKENEDPNVPVPEVKEKPVGSTVQIRIPVVATVIQQSGQGGRFSMSVVSPGPNRQEATGTSQDDTGSSFVFSSNMSPENVLGINQESDPNASISSGFGGSSTIQYLDQSGRIISEEEFRNDMVTNNQTKNDLINPLNLTDDSPEYIQLNSLEETPTISAGNNTTSVNAVNDTDVDKIEFLML